MNPQGLLIWTSTFGMLALLALVSAIAIVRSAPEKAVPGRDGDWLSRGLGYSVDGGRARTAGEAGTSLSHFGGRPATLVGLALALLLGLMAGVLLQAGRTQDGMAVTHLTVQAYKDWQDTGVHVSKGQPMVITGRGEWTNQKSRVSFGAEGSSRKDDGAVLPDAPIGSLIGRIQDSEPFLIGKGAAMAAPEPGILQLQMNDWPDDRQNSWGSIDVTVSLLDP